MKHILLIICIACTTTAMAVDYQSNPTLYGAENKHTDATFATTPEVVFRSTSAMPSIGSTLSSAEGIAIGDETPAPAGPKRVGPSKPPADPFDDPRGDIPWIFMLILAGGYVASAWRKSKQDTDFRTPDTQQ